MAVPPQRRTAGVALALLAASVALGASPAPVAKDPLAALHAKKISFDFVETPFQDVCSFLSSLIEVTLVLDVGSVRGEAPNVTLKVDDLPADHALAWVCKLAGLVHAVRDGAIVVTTRERLDRAFPPPELERYFGLPPHEAGETLKKLERLEVSFDFVETPLQDVVEFLRSLTDTPLTLDRAALADDAPTVTLKVFEMRLGRALRWVCRHVQMTYAWRDGALLITTPERLAELDRQDKALAQLEEALSSPLRRQLNKTVTVSIVNQPVPEAVAGLVRAQLGVPVAVDTTAPPVPLRRVTLREKAIRLDAALRRLCRSAALTPMWLDWGLFVGPRDQIEHVLHLGAERPVYRRPPNRRLGARMARPTTLALADLPLPRALDALRLHTGLDIVAHPELAGDGKPTVSLTLSDMPLDWALEWICHTTGTDFLWRSGQILVAPRERVRHRAWRQFHQPPTKSLADAMAKPVGIAFVRRPLDEALDFLGRLTRVPIVLHPPAVAGGTPVVSFASFGQRLDTFTWDLCRSLGLVCVWHDGALLVAAPEHATAALLAAEQAEAQRQ